MGSQERALVVDDDVSIRLMLTRILEREHFEVDSAKDGVEAIEKLSGSEYDIVFLDLMMPRIDGIGVLRHVRKHTPEMLPNIVVMTAFNKVADEVIDSNEQVGKIIEKPFDIAELVSYAKERAQARNESELNPT